MNIDIDVYIICNIDMEIQFFLSILISHLYHCNSTFYCTVYINGVRFSNVFEVETAGVFA